MTVACGMLSHSTSMAVQSCWILAELRHTVVHVNPEHPQRAQWVTCLVSMQAMKKQGHFQVPGIVYRPLRHGAVHYQAET
jgi:hypothetical protein